MTLRARLVLRREFEPVPVQRHAATVAQRQLIAEPQASRTARLTRRVALRPSLGTRKHTGGSQWVGVNGDENWKIGLPLLIIVVVALVWFNLECTTPCSETDDPEQCEAERREDQP